MKKILYLFLVILVGFNYQSCSDDDDANIDEAWKQSNENAFNAKGSDPNYKKAEIPGGPGFIYYKELQPATSDVRALETSTAKVFYKGAFIDGSVFDYGSSVDNNPKYLKVGNMIKGMKIALQTMKKGAKWEIWIPWDLGYGSTLYAPSGATSIPAYSTLVFEVEMLDVINP